MAARSARGGAQRGADQPSPGESYATSNNSVWLVATFLHDCRLDWAFADGRDARIWACIREFRSAACGEHRLLPELPPAPRCRARRRAMKQRGVPRWLVVASAMLALAVGAPSRAAGAT